jgi:hypothetical protein
VVIEGHLPVGEIVPVRITGAMTYDLTGVVDTGSPAIISINDVQVQSDAG